MTLKLGRFEFADDATLMMAIVNRTPDSFYDKGATWDEDRALERVAHVAREGAEIQGADGTALGLVTSGGFGPSVGGPVAMG